MEETKSLNKDRILTLILLNQTRSSGMKSRGVYGHSRIDHEHSCVAAYPVAAPPLRITRMMSKTVTKAD
ncbi:unnamed protein product [Cochlearia groenlandica]